MRAPLSIVIPTLDAEAELPQSLRALTEGLEAGLIRELIVSDGGSTDSTLTIADDAGALVLAGDKGRGQQLSRGAATAQGDWLLFLHADTFLPDGWSRAVFEHFKDGQAAVFGLTFREYGLAPLIIAGWANFRTRIFKLPYGDQGLLIPRSLFDEVGGFAEIPLMEDVEMALKLRGRTKVLPLKVSTSAARYVRDGWLNRSVRNAVLLMRYLAGADPVSLQKSYTRTR